MRARDFFLQVIDKRTLCMQWTITSFYKLNFLNLQISKGCFLPFIVFQILKNKIKNIRLSYWKNRTDLEVGDEHICPLGVGHLDFILEVLLGGKEVPDLLVVDLKEGRLDNKILVLTWRYFYPWNTNFLKFFLFSTLIKTNVWSSLYALNICHVYLD